MIKAIPVLTGALVAMRRVGARTLANGTGSRRRRLTEEEIRLASGVFGASIEYGKVKIYNRPPAWAAPGPQPGITPFGEIHFAHASYRPNFGYAALDEKALFIHEMTHVWQHQHGVNVALRGLCLHARSGWGLVHDPYSYDWPDAGDEWTDYNIEQQGQLVEDFWYLASDPQDASGPQLDVFRKLFPFTPTI